MVECISQINTILDLMIKISIITGIFFLIYFYIRLKFLDSKIEHEYNKFEKERDGKRGQGCGIPEAIINGQIEALQRKKDEFVAPLERKRQRIISKIPFIR